MTSVDPSSSAPSAEPSEDELREMLEAAERRRDAEMSRNSRTFSIILAISTLAVLVWAAIFFLQHRAGEKPLTIKTATADPAAALKSKVVADLDRFRPGDTSTGSQNKPSVFPMQGGQIIDKEDVSFAMQMLNFMQAPPKKDEKKR